MKISDIPKEDKFKTHVSDQFWSALTSVNVPGSIAEFDDLVEDEVRYVVEHDDVEAVGCVAQRGKFCSLMLFCIMPKKVQASSSVETSILVDAIAEILKTLMAQAKEKGAHTFTIMFPIDNLSELDCARVMCGITHAHHRLDGSIIYSKSLI